MGRLSGVSMDYTLHQRFVILFVCGAVFTTGGCAVHRYDAATGTEQVWGLGYMRVRVQPPTEGMQAVMTQRTVGGVDIGVGGDSRGLTVGWNSVTRITAADDSTAVRIDWPTSSLADVRIGSRPPWLTPEPQPAVSASLSVPPAP